MSGGWYTRPMSELEQVEQLEGEGRWRISGDSSTDGEFEQRAAETQPYNVVELIVTTGQRSARTEDGVTEHVEPVTENLSSHAGKRIAGKHAVIRQKVEDFKKENPDFDQVVNQPIPIPLAVRDEIFRMPNGPAIAHFLGFASEVAEQLSAMHPLDAIKCIESISEDLDRGSLPGDESDYDTWEKNRNRLVGSKTRRGS